MPFMVHDKEAVISFGAGDSEMESLQEGLSKVESGGWTLHSIIQQHTDWSEDDNTPYKVGPYFIFHKESDKPKGEFRVFGTD